MTNGDMIREAIKSDPELFDEALSDYYLARGYGIVCTTLHAILKDILDEDLCKGCPLYDSEKPNFDCLDRDKLSEWLLEDYQGTTFSTPIVPADAE